MDWLWLGLTFLCIILELMTTGIFFILFAVGTLAAFIYALFSSNIVGEVLTFAVLSVVCLLFLRPILRKWLHLDEVGQSFGVPDYIEQNVGKEATVTRMVSVAAKGQVRIGYELWTAKTLSGGPFEVGEVVRVVGIEGVTAVIERIEM